MKPHIDEAPIDTILDQLEAAGTPDAEFHLYVSVYDETFDLEGHNFPDLKILARQDGNLYECLATHRTITALRRYRGGEICTVKPTLW